MHAEGELSPAEVESLVASHTVRIAEAVPEGRTSVSGSTLLGQYGGHDVDLVVLVPRVAAAADRLRSVYPPLYEDEWREDWAAFRVEGPPQVDIVVTTPGTKGDDHHRRAWDLLLADARLRAEYEALKSDGMDSVQKAAFFDRLVDLLPPVAVLRGRCACKAAAYEVEDAFVAAYNCHCSNCRALTGSAFLPWGEIEREKLRVTEGGASLLVQGDPDAAYAVHCGECFSLLYWTPREGYFRVPYGTLVDEPTVKPTAHIFVGSKAPWYEISDDLPQHDEYP